MELLQKLNHSKLFSATAVLGYLLIPLTIISYAIYTNTGVKKAGPTYSDPTGYPTLSKDIASITESPPDEPIVVAEQPKPAPPPRRPAPKPQPTAPPVTPTIQTADHKDHDRPEKPDKPDKPDQRDEEPEPEDELPDVEEPQPEDDENPGDDGGSNDEDPEQQPVTL